MKRFLAAFIAIVFVFSLSIRSTRAAETGEMLITSDKVCGEVGNILKVNFYLYANLPDERKLDSLSGSLKYDPEFLTFGTINQEDKDENLSSFMKGKASSFQSNLVEPGLIKFAYIDGYGVEASGFWFQAEFRIEKEGATDFVFNGITYTGLKTVQKEDGSTGYETVTFRIDPMSVGGIYTEGEVVPTDGADQETFEPLQPAVQTPEPATPTPKPENPGQTVPITTLLPTYSAQPSTPSGLVTPSPAVTSIPMKTPQPQPSVTTVPPTQQTETTAPTQQTETPAPTPELTSVPEATPELTQEPSASAEITTAEPSETPEPENTPTQEPYPVETDPIVTETQTVPSIRVGDVIYGKTEETFTGTVDPSSILGTIDSSVPSQRWPSENGQANFDGIGSAYAMIENGLVVQIDGTWVLFTPVTTVESEPATTAAPVETPTEEPADPTQKNISDDNNSPLRDTLLTVGIIIGIVAVVALGVLAIIFILKRRKQYR